MGMIIQRTLMAAFFALIWVTCPLSGQQINIRTIRPEKEDAGPHYNGEDLYFHYENLLKSSFFYRGETIMLIPQSVSVDRKVNYYSNFFLIESVPDSISFGNVDLSRLVPYQGRPTDGQWVADIDGAGDYVKGSATPYDTVEGVPMQIINIAFNKDQFGIHDYRMLLRDGDGHLVLFVNGLEKTRQFGDPDVYYARTEKELKGGRLSSYTYEEEKAVVEHYPTNGDTYRSRPFFMGDPIKRAQEMVGRSFRVKPVGKYGTDGRFVRALDGGRYYEATGVYRCTEVCFMAIGFMDKMMPCMILTDKDGNEFFSTIGSFFEIKPYDEPVINGSTTKTYSNLVILHDLAPMKE